MDKNNDNGLSLVKKWQKGLLGIIFSRLAIIIILFCIQLLFFFGVFRFFANFIPHILGSTLVFSAAIVIYIFNSKLDPNAKTTWLFVIMLFPVFGAAFFRYTQSNFGFRMTRKRLNDISQQSRDSIGQDKQAMENLKKEDPQAASLADYIASSGCYPVYENSHVTYFPTGMDKFNRLMQELEKAEKFIFMEYFIIDEGLMWGKILETLVKKAREGVEVRVMYDGTCEFSTLPANYPERLKKLGIKCKMFAPMTPFISTHYNYRDHRKILVIDGNVAFTGGINLADEYINRIEKHGYWKDTAIMLRGECVKSFTLMFLQLWSINEQFETDGFIAATKPLPQGNGGYVIPYGDSPFDDEKVGKMVYTHILDTAQEYVDIMSPYLILDGRLEQTIKFAAKRGVKVRLILPGIPDKKTPYALAKTHYASLLASGVEIYEFTPGFVHAKVFVSDDKKAVVGTINLDYRSLYHHFECAAFMYKNQCIPDIKQDFESTLAQCRRVTMQTVKKESVFTKLLGAIIKPFAPLM